MEPQQIGELARAIANQSLVDAWPYWVALLCIGFLVSVGGGFLGSYAAKRGEVKAEKADRKEILDALRATTEAAEKVKSTISLGEWNERERRTVRRNKLEEMLLLAYKAREWQIGELERVANPNLPERPNSQTTMAILGNLYFPELKDGLKAYDRACDVYSGFIGSLRIRALQAQTNTLTAPAEVTRILAGASVEILEKQQSMYKALLDLERAASQLMTKIIAPSA